MIKRYILRVLMICFLWICIPYLLVSFVSHYFEESSLFLRLLKYIGLYFSYTYLKTGHKLLVDIHVNDKNNIVLKNYILFFGKDKLIIPLEENISFNTEKSKWLRMAHFSISSKMVNQSFAVDAYYEKELQEKSKKIPVFTAVKKY